MNKITKIVPFHPEHFDLMDIRDHELENIFCVKNYKKKFKALVAIGVSATIIYDNKILGVMGVFDMYKGVCEVWVIPCKITPKYGITFARILKKYLEQIWNMGHYHRIQVTALNDKVHNRFFKWLGFELETPNGMKNYTIKKCNYNMWARTT